MVSDLLLTIEADQVYEGSPFSWIKIISCLEDFYYFKTKRIQIQVLWELLRMTNTKNCKLRARKAFYIINFIWMNKSYNFFVKKKSMFEMQNSLSVRYFSHDLLLFPEKINSQLRDFYHFLWAIRGLRNSHSKSNILRKREFCLVLFCAHAFNGYQFWEAQRHSNTFQTTPVLPFSCIISYQMCLTTTQHNIYPWLLCDRTLWSFTQLTCAQRYLLCCVCLCWREARVQEGRELGRLEWQKLVCFCYFIFFKIICSNCLSEKVDF